MRVGVEEGARGHDLTRRANATLKPAVVDKGLLQRIEVAVVGQALDRRDLRAVGEDGGRDARGDHLAVHEDRAGATHAHRAPFLGAGQAEIVAEKVDQQPSW